MEERMREKRKRNKEKNKKLGSNTFDNVSPKSH